MKRTVRGGVIIKISVSYSAIIIPEPSRRGKFLPRERLENPPAPSPSPREFGGWLMETQTEQPTHQPRQGLTRFICFGAKLLFYSALSGLGVGPRPPRPGNPINAYPKWAITSITQLMSLATELLLPLFLINQPRRSRTFQDLSRNRPHAGTPPVRPWPPRYTRS